MDDYVAKPLDPEVLALVVGRWSGRAPPTPPAEARLRSAGADATIDRARLEQLREIARESDPSLFAELVEGFLQNSPPRIESLRGAVAAGDPRRLAEVAHALRGASGIVGANRLAALCGEAEDQGRDGREGVADALPGLIDRIEAEFESVRKILEHEESAERRESDQ
jgi:HPt (histidine-containing phosphotransfer) domain-containing protein